MELNEKQQQAVEHKDGPLLIVAGAGSGKTRTLTSRVIKLLQDGVPPEKILAITFTNKAAAEMLKRISTRYKIQDIRYKPFVGTFHSFGASILRKEAKHFSRTAGFTIFDGNDSMSLFRKVIKNLNLSRDRTQLGKLYYEVGKIKNTLDDKVDDDVAQLAFKEYENALQRSNAFDFDDLIEKPVRLFIANKNVLEKYQQRYGYILVDEFQDTNTAQYLLIKTLAQKHNNLTVVGDDAQSIYGWRYADFRNFLDFENDWPNTKTVFLEENYRSSANILSAANGVIGHNKLQKQKKLWTQNKAGEKIAVINAGDEEEEASWVANQIVILSANEGSKDSSASPQNDMREIAILYRTNAQSRALEQALIYRRIPYRIFGGVKFYERKEIKDIMACLRLAANPKDEISLDRLQKNFSKTKNERLIRDLPRLAKELTIVQLIDFILNNTDYIEYLDRNFKNANDRVENVQELIKFASSFVISNSATVIPDHDPGSTLQKFLEQTSLIQAHDQPSHEATARQSNPQGQSGVNLMTIHLAKGLEFDNVFISGCADGILPHQRSYFSKEQLEEERRLMYVAMTRARKNLFLTLAGTPSRFLYEIPPELTEFIDLSERRGKLPDEEEGWITYD